MSSSTADEEAYESNDEDHRKQIIPTPHTHSETPPYHIPSSLFSSTPHHEYTDEQLQHLQEHTSKYINELLDISPTLTSDELYQQHPYTLYNPLYETQGSVLDTSGLPPLYHLHLSTPHSEWALVRHCNGDVIGFEEVSIPGSDDGDDKNTSRHEGVKRIYGSVNNRPHKPAPSIFDTPQHSQQNQHTNNTSLSSRSKRNPTTYSMNTDDEYLFPWDYPNHPAYRSEMSTTAPSLPHGIPFKDWNSEVAEVNGFATKDQETHITVYNPKHNATDELSQYLDMTDEAYNDAIEHIKQTQRHRQQHEMELKMNEPPAVHEFDEFVVQENNSLQSDNETDTMESKGGEKPIAAAESSVDGERIIDDTDDDQALVDQEAMLLSQNLQRTADSTTSAPRLKATELSRSYAIADTAPVDAFASKVPQPAINYPFPLDTFQKRSIMRLEDNKDVFVAAHTSAGKTVVAEYAIALALKHMSKVVYTSPIKTLSNQKFRDFRKTFGDKHVGIITGDVSIQPEANCLIMTTEILRSMLYKGADLIRDLEYVIFDEIHYINDIERGVVWEEVIIMLPAHVKFVLLSATVSNVMEFVNWIGRTKSRFIYVSNTLKRPVPLHHYLWIHHNLYEIMGDRGWQSNGYKQARAITQQKEKDNKQKKIGQYTGRSTQQSWYQLLQHLKKKELLPVVIFSFRKKSCEDGADQLHNLDLLTQRTEKSEVTLFLNKSLKTLSTADRQLPQVLRIRELVMRGIGIHHAGMLPILKEIVEILFQCGLVKVLFATETFAMGVNMPAKSVVFSNTRKHDGVQFRDLTSGEYTQMSGRAGRRGLDAFGVVIIYCHNDTLPDEQATRTLLMGKANTLSSRFKLTYNMILSLLRTEELSVEAMMKRSFYENLNSSQIPTQRMEIAKYEQLLESLPQPHCNANDHQCNNIFHDYYTYVNEYNTLAQQNYSYVFKTPDISKKFLAAGRVLLVKKFDINAALAVVLKASDKHVTYRCLLLAPHKDYTLPTRYANDESIILSAAAGQQYIVCPIAAKDTLGITSHTINNVDANGILVDGHVNKIAPVVQQLVRVRDKYDQPLTSGSEIGVLDVYDDLHVRDLDVVDNAFRMKELKTIIQSHICHRCPHKQSNILIMDKRTAVMNRLQYLRTLLSDQNLILIGEFESRLGVLEKLQYINSQRIVQLKGRIACEINTCDSLILVETLLHNAFGDLTPHEIVALLSCLICQEKIVDELPALPERLQRSVDQLYDTATALAHLQLSCGLDINTEEWINSNVNSALCHVVYEWSLGMPFSEVCQLTSVAEGSIVRCITRLDETCRDLRNAAKTIGDLSLYAKAEKASESIKRDIVFAASLYTT